MNDQIQKLVALGASAAVNCRPCLEHHLGEARRLESREEDISAAIEVGLQVNQGAARQTRNFVESLLGEVASPVSAASAGASGPGCC